MAYIRVDQAMPVFDGQPVTFKSPASCKGVEGLKVCYPAGEGTEVATFALADAHGNNVGSIDLFAADVLVKVILDTERGMAYVQNADTNAYLEGRFEELQYVDAGVNYEDNLTTSGDSARMSGNLIYGLGYNAQHDAVRINSVSVKLTAAGTVRFGAYSLTKSADGTTGVLTLEKLLGEVTLDAAGTAELTIEGGWRTDKWVYLIACAESAIIEYFGSGGGLTLKSYPYFDDASYYANEEGDTISCDLGSHPLQTAIGSVNYDAIEHMTVEEFALRTSTAAKELDARVKKAEADILYSGKPAMRVDLAAFESSGTIVETCANGSKITYTMERNAEGKITKITDSNGNVTVLTW